MLITFILEEDFEDESEDSPDSEVQEEEPTGEWEIAWFNFGGIEKRNNWFKHISCGHESISWNYVT